MVCPKLTCSWTAAPCLLESFLQQVRRVPCLTCLRANLSQFPFQSRWQPKLNERYRTRCLRHLLILRAAISASKAQIIQDLAPAEVQENLHLISHPADVPILLSAIKANLDYLVMHNRAHLIDDPDVAIKAKLRIGTPRDTLDWVRIQLSARE